MTVILDVLLSIYAVFAIIPILTFIFVWLIAYFFVKDKKLSTRVSMDITTFFLIGSVTTLWNRLFGTQFGFWLILLVLLIGFGLIGGYQTKEKGQTDLLKVSRLVWRLSFVGLTVLYVILFLINIVVV
ncbi:hypothetical protein D3C73_576980 [compost metagenome]